MAKASLTRGTAVLLAGNVINRTTSFLFRIYLIRTIGAEGIGLYQRVTSVFFTLLILTTAGFPAALPILVAQAHGQNNHHSVHRTTRLAFALILATGLAATLILAAQAPLIAGRLLRDPRAAPAIATIAPALLFCAAASILRGYFQGRQEMAPIAASQVTEEFVQIAVTWGLLRQLTSPGPAAAATILVIGLVVSEAAGFTAISLAYLRSRARTLTDARSAVPRPEPSRLAVLRSLGRLALPVTGLRLVLSMLSTLSAILIPARLQAAGATLRLATAQYGQLAAVAVTLVHLPSVFTSALSASLVPAVAEATARGDRRQVGAQSRKAIRYTYMLGLPTTAFLLLLSRPLTTVLFRTPAAGEPLAIFATGAVFIYLQQVSSGILTGLGQTALPLRNISLANALTLPALYYLTGLPGVGIRGAAAAMAAGGILGCLLNFASLRHLSVALFDLRHLLRTVAATLLAAVAVHLAYAAAPAGAAALAVALAAGTLTYGAALVGLGGFRVD